MLLLLLSRFSRVRLCATHRRLPNRFTVPGILQARTLVWVAISFSNQGLANNKNITNGIPLQYSCLENSMDRGAWCGY